MQRFFFILILLCGLLKAESRTIYRITYNGSYYLMGMTKNDVHALDIDGDVSRFYSKLFMRDRQIQDSLNDCRAFNLSELRRLTTGLKDGQGYEVMKNVPERGRLTFRSKLGKNTYIYDEDMPELNWQIGDRDTIVLGYKCQAAEVKLRGREWKVWFTAEIPIPEGPWKLCGLPGLILKAADKDNLFTFECSGIERLNLDDIGLKSKADVEKCTPKEYQTLYSKSVGDPVGFIEQEHGFDLTEVVIKTYGAQAVAKKKVELIEDYNK